MNGMKRVVLVAVVAALMIGALPGRTMAAVKGNSYASESFGFSLSWDASVWTGQDATLADGAEGVRLDSPQAGYGMIMAVPAANVDPEACLAYLESSWGDDSEGITEFSPAPRRTEEPASPIGGEHGVYDAHIKAGTDETDLTFYLECLPIQGGDAALMVSLITSTGAYPDAIPLWEDLLATVEIDTAGSTGATGHSGHSSTTAGKEQTYEDAAGYSVSYDAAVWDGTPWKGDGDTGIELDNGTTLVYVRTLSLAGEELRNCPLDIAAQFQQGETFGPLRKAPASMEHPVIADGAEAGLWTTNITNSVSKYVFYAECRDLGDGVALAVIALTDNANYADELPLIQAVLDGIILDGGSAHDAARGKLGRQN
jgi:hypothetical protein